MRGKVDFGLYIFIPVGITPAYAGKRSLDRPGYSFFEDHPRVCGEKLKLIAAAILVLGSPPRMRGKDERNAKDRAAVGITPAYAGKRTSERCRMRRSGDHPRVCGEKRNGCSYCYARRGSPPRMRGKDICLLDLNYTLGITPAYAGKRISGGAVCGRV